MILCGFAGLFDGNVVAPIGHEMSYFNYQSKRIYDSEQGLGKPGVFLHGDTASSKMFEILLPLYADNFKVIQIDFLGNGKSDRVEEFPVDLWQEEARQTIALLEHLQYGKVNLVGTSGGAWVAINAALERPDLVERVVADSFDGRTLAEYETMAGITGAEICIFESGFHSAIASNGERAAEVIDRFLNCDDRK